MEAIKWAMKKWLNDKDFKKQLSTLQTLAEVKKALAKILPAELNQEIRPLKIVDSRIVVTASRPQWSNELKFYEKRIVEELARQNVFVRGFDNGE